MEKSGRAGHPCRTRISGRRGDGGGWDIYSHTLQFWMAHNQLQHPPRTRLPMQMQSLFSYSSRINLEGKEMYGVFTPGIRICKQIYPLLPPDQCFHLKGFRSFSTIPNPRNLHVSSPTQLARCRKCLGAAT